ncbi:sensor domain-containing protein [Acinetobacter wuhouensis]|uniref:Bifunctional diguanylate cyclase/phosphodiesterase n=1 Tax=Acinetobacter wuhouensis TaxID=1879050 RepID=A0A3G2T255_9GAMM|nr:bifunctional diguanylate cyclase/phosphodiesterase [Acinetobacter wuhouensis]AYO54330.1 bifunctional diguanylate cyclase/phosphodiesterase [Acinetobacter wuhouensis]
MASINLPLDSNLNQVDSSANSIPVKVAQISNEVKQALDLMPHLVWMTKLGVGYCNTPLKQFIGIESNNICDTDWIKYLHPEDAEHIYNIWITAQKTGQNFEKECRIRNVDGHYQWFLLLAQSTEYGRKQFDWTITCTNIHDRALLLRETSESLRANTDMLDVSVDCIKIITPDGFVSHMNKSGCIALLGKEKVKTFGMEWLGLLPPEVRDQGKKAIKQAAKGKNARFAGKSVFGNLTMYWDNILTPVVNEEGQTTSILCVSRDVTKQRIAEEKLRITSEFDEMTGLMNRRAFKKKLKTSITKAKDERGQIGLLLIDLDHFKHINDTLGHSAGDHLLKVLSKRLAHCLDENAYISRLGGDEFAVVIENIESNEQIINVSKKLLKQLEAPITYSGKLLNGGMSIGGSVYPVDAKDGSGLLKCADTALNDLKDRGRGGIRMFGVDMFEIAQMKAKQLDTARQIIRNNQIEPFYQPKVKLDDCSIIGFEALLRWRDEDSNIHSPATVVEAFNDFELATKISETMHNKIFTDMSAWISQGINVVPISINASPVEFMRDNYAEILLKRLAAYKIPHDLVEIEITEHILADRGYEYVVRALKKLKNSGVRIALDDFGTGHSSMTHLRDYPVDSLKIDYNFVNRMHEEKSIKAIVEGIAKLGPILSLDIIAEGIETVEQLDSLRAAGCKFGQGFLFSQAISADDAKQMLI